MRRLLTALLLLGVLAGVSAKESTVLLVMPREEQAIEQAFKAYLRQRGLTVRFESLIFSGRPADVPALLQQVRARRPDLIYTWGTPTTLAVAGPHVAPNVADIPIVFAEVADPVGAGIVRQRVPSSGRNVTGVVHIALLAVQIATLRAYRPLKRLGYIANPAEPNTMLVGEALRALSREQDFELMTEVLPLARSGEADVGALPDIMHRLSEFGIDFLYIGPSTFLAFTHRERVTRLALEYSIPTFCATESIVRKASCLFGISSNAGNLGRFVGFKVAGILAEGKPVASLPIETLKRFSLLINMPVAAALQLYPPLPMLNVAEVLGVPGSDPGGAPPR